MRMRAASLWICLTLAPLGGCTGGSTEVLEPVHAQPEIAALAFSVAVASGTGQLQRETEVALNQALAEAGFQLTDSDADLNLVAVEKDQEAPQFFKIVVNGTEQKKLTVLVTLRVMGGERRDQQLEEFSTSFMVTQGEAIDPKQMRPLVKRLVESKKLQELGLNLAIDRSRKKLNTMGVKDGAESDPSDKDAGEKTGGEHKPTLDE